MVSYKRIHIVRSGICKDEKGLLDNTGKVYLLQLHCKEQNWSTIDFEKYFVTSMTYFLDNFSLLHEYEALLKSVSSSGMFLHQEQKENRKHDMILKKEIKWSITNTLKFAFKTEYYKVIEKSLYSNLFIQNYCKVAMEDGSLLNNFSAL